MADSNERLRKATLETRVKLHCLLASGLTVKQSIDGLFPPTDSLGQRCNSNRMKKLREWIRKGLWPISSKDIEEAKEIGLCSEVPTMPTQPQFAGRATHDRLTVSVGRQPRHPFPQLIESSEDADQPRTVPVSVRLPYDLVRELKQLNGTMTGTLTLAASLYLGTLRQQVSQ